MRKASRPVRPAYIAATLAVVAMAAMAFGPCGTGVRDKTPSKARPMVAGEVLGKVGAPSADGTPIVARTLLSVTCREGVVVVRTNVDGISALMDCSRPVPQSSLDRFIGVPVIITYTGDVLRVENSNAGKLEIPATDATVGSIDATP
ncbi:MAG: hypothetical protein HY874_10590 [Chloroflexi bacterium]|nr:hypothetical protein [Chloroflexota bacterium]